MQNVDIMTFILVLGKLLTFLLCNDFQVKIGLN